WWICLVATDSWFAFRANTSDFSCQNTNFGIPYNELYILSLAPVTFRATKKPNTNNDSPTPQTTKSHGLINRLMIKKITDTINNMNKGGLRRVKPNNSWFELLFTVPFASRRNP